MSKYIALWVEDSPEDIREFEQIANMKGIELKWFSNAKDANRYLDASIERIIEAYKEAGIYEDTVFILTSDHGGNGKTHGYDSLKELKTPFVMWGKGVNHIGYVGDEMEQKDVGAIMATILNLKMPKLWSGNSHLSYFK